MLDYFLSFAKKKVRNYCQKIALSSVSLKAPHAKYGHIYYPMYNLDAEMADISPEFYTSDGRRMEMFFLRDSHIAHAPYIASNHFQFDRYNFGLKTHFYTHGAMLETMGSPTKKYGILIESEGIVPDDYALFDKHAGLEKDYDLIFTYSERLLNLLPNARFVPFAASPWYGRARGEFVDESIYTAKSRGVSIVSSDKKMCDLHRIRFDLAQKCKNLGLADAYGTFDGGAYINSGVALENYRYSIIIENDLQPFFFTEKLTNCFVSMTIPIYIGATKIDQFFNPDGIISLNVEDLDDIENVLNGCTECDYESRLDAMKDNFARVKRYFRVWDFMYEEYLLRR